MDNQEIIDPEPIITRIGVHRIIECKKAPQFILRGRLKGVPHMSSHPYLELLISLLGLNTGLVAVKTLWFIIC